MFVAVGVFGPATDASALWEDRLELFVSERITYDTNVFRISSGADPVRALGTSSKQDTYFNTSLGLNLNVPVGRQRFQGGLALNDYRYDRFSVLDLTGHEARAIWLWEAGSALSGQLGFTETRALASLTNVQSGVQSSTPNPLRTQRGFVNVGYRMAARWRVDGEASRVKQSNEAFVSQVNDITIDSAEAALSYVTPANNRIGLGVRRDDGRMPNEQAIAGLLVDNSFQQDRIFAVTDWTPTGHSHLNARVGWLNRNHDQLSQRDFDGVTFRVVYDWTPTGKFSLATIAQRDTGNIAEINIGFLMVKGLALRPTLRLTEKVEIGGFLEYSKRDYLGDPGMVLGTVRARTDNVRAAALTASYRPLRKVRLDMSLGHETRSSTAVLGDYSATTVSVSAWLGI